MLSLSLRGISDAGVMLAPAKLGREASLGFAMFHDGFAKRRTVRRGAPASAGKRPKRCRGLALALQEASRSFAKFRNASRCFARLIEASQCRGAPISARRRRRGLARLREATSRCAPRHQSGIFSVALQPSRRIRTKRGVPPTHGSATASAYSSASACARSDAALRVPLARADLSSSAQVRQNLPQCFRHSPLLRPDAQIRSSRPQIARTNCNSGEVQHHAGRIRPDVCRARPNLS